MYILSELFLGGFMSYFASRYYKFGVFFAFLFLIVGCQSSEKLNHKNFIVNESLYIDEYFPNFQNIKIETQEEIFALDDQMRLMVKENLMTEPDIKKRSIKLLENIFFKTNVALAYNATANISAIEAYHSQQANCLSLTILAYALAKEANLDVNFQNVKIPEYWVRNASYNMLTGHVNLIITKPKDPRTEILFRNEILTIDFDPYVNKKSFPKTIISQSDIISMFYSNKGAQALVKKQYTKAYAYLKAATTTSPNFSSAWANLGILYKVSGNVNLAKQSYRYAIEVNRENYTAMSNLALLLDNQNDSKELTNIRKLLKNKRDSNPYYYALLADEAFYVANYEQALVYYRKAIKLNNQAHEFYFGLAKVYYALNENYKAQNAIARAISYNRAVSIDERYTAKLDFLKNQEDSH
jgi:tetratricopeptide (TPR) repeat protein